MDLFATSWSRLCRSFSYSCFLLGRVAWPRIKIKELRLQVAKARFLAPCFSQPFSPIQWGAETNYCQLLSGLFSVLEDCAAPDWPLSSAWFVHDSKTGTQPLCPAPANPSLVFVILSPSSAHWSCLISKRSASLWCPCVFDGLQLPASLEHGRTAWTHIAGELCLVDSQDVSSAPSCAAQSDPWSCGHRVIWAARCAVIGIEQLFPSSPFWPQSEASRDKLSQPRESAPQERQADRGSDGAPSSVSSCPPPPLRPKPPTTPNVARARGKEIAESWGMDFNFCFQRKHLESKEPIEKGHWTKFLEALGNSKALDCYWQLSPTRPTTLDRRAFSKTFVRPRLLSSRLCRRPPFFCCSSVRSGFMAGGEQEESVRACTRWSRTADDVHMQGVWRGLPLPSHLERLLCSPARAYSGPQAGYFGTSRSPSDSARDLHWHFAHRPNVCENSPWPACFFRRALVTAGLPWLFTWRVLRLRCLLEHCFRRAALSL